MKQIRHTVGGRNPAPVDMESLPFLPWCKQIQIYQITISLRNSSMDRTHPVMLCRECLTNQQFELRYSDSTPRNSHTPASNSTGSWATSEPLRNEQTEAAAGKVHSSFDHTWWNLAFSCWLSVTLYTNCNTNSTCLGPTVWPTDCPDSSSMWCFWVSGHVMSMSEVQIIRASVLARRLIPDPAALYWQWAARRCSWT